MSAGKDNKPKRDARGRLLPGSTANKKGLSAKVRNGEGRAPKALLQHPRTVGLPLLQATNAEFAELMKDPTKEQLGWASLIDKMCEGDVPAFRACMDYVYGKPRESIAHEVTGANGGPLVSTEMNAEQYAEALRELQELERRRKELDGV